MLPESGNIYTQTDDRRAVIGSRSSGRSCSLFCGLEDKEDLIADLAQALDAIQ